MNADQIAAEVVQRQALLYGIPITPKEELTSSSETKKLHKPKPRIRAKVASEDSPNPQEPRASVTNKTGNTKSHSTNSSVCNTRRPPLTTPHESVVRSHKSNPVEIPKHGREIPSSAPNGHATRRNKGKIRGQHTGKHMAPKIESIAVEKNRSHQTHSTTANSNPNKRQTDSVPSQQSGHHHQRRIQNSQRSESSKYNSRNSSSCRQLPPQEHRLENSKSSSRTSIESTKSGSSGSRSMSSRLEFDGTIKRLSPTDYSKKKLGSISQVEQHRWGTGTTTYNTTNSTSTTADNTHRSSNVSQSPVTPIEPSTSINKNHCQGIGNTANTSSNIEVDKAEAMNHHSRDGIERAIDVPSDNVQSSRCTTRRKVCWGVICCIFIAAAIAVPCVLLLVDFSGNNFPKLSGARGVVASLPSDVCSETVPKSGDCTSMDSSEVQQGGELCNLVAKSMINTTINGDFALINAGVCKQSLLAPELTAGGIKTAIDGQSLVLVEISGADLVDVLNGALTASFGASADPLAYPYAAGLRYNVEANLPLSERLTKVEVNRGLRGDEWKPIDIRRFYKVITTSSLAEGGMGYVSFGNVIDDWKEPLNIKTGDAFYNYAMKHSDDANWSVLPSSEYSTQYFIEESEEPAIAMVPSRICHAMVPGQPQSSFCTSADVVHGSEVCNLLSWMIYDQNFGINMVLLKGRTCAADIEEGKFVESSFDIVLSENKSLVKVDLLGSDIVNMLNDGVTLAVGSGEVGEYPYAAALKFQVSPAASPTMVSNVRIQTSGGNWIPIDWAETYTVATTSDLLEETSTAEDMGTTLRDQIISYAEDWSTFYKSSADKASTQSYLFIP